MGSSQVIPRRLFWGLGVETRVLFKWTEHLRVLAENAFGIVEMALPLEILHPSEVFPRLEWRPMESCQH